MKKYGKQLMNQLPDATTDLLKSLCTDWIPKGMDTSAGMVMGESLGHVTTSLCELFVVCEYRQCSGPVKPGILHQDICQPEAAPHAVSRIPN